MSFRDSQGPRHTRVKPYRATNQGLGVSGPTALPLHGAPSPRTRGSRDNEERVVPMPKRRQLEEPQEPIGIVISGGPHEDPTPKLTAYVYSIEDETSGEPIDVKAA